MPKAASKKEETKTKKKATKAKKDPNAPKVWPARYAQRTLLNLLHVRAPVDSPRAWQRAILLHTFFGCSGGSRSPQGSGLASDVRLD